MARVVAPGGVVSWTDSIQRGDRPPLDDLLINFSNLNEPHYEDYIATDVGALFAAGGLRRGSKSVASTSKTLSFTKPLESERAGADGGEGEDEEELWDAKSGGWVSASQLARDEQ